MEKMNRKRFVKLAGAGSAAAAVGGAGVFAGRLASLDVDGENLHFRASAGLPEAPLPAYATHVVEGTVNLATGAGLVTSRVLAGLPGAQGTLGLPGASRTVRISEVTGDRGVYRLSGTIEERSQLRRGESPRVEIVIDKGRRTVKAPFLGRRVDHLIA
jgi:hypothetical protein